MIIWYVWRFYLDFDDMEYHLKFDKISSDESKEVKIEKFFFPMLPEWLYVSS